MQTIFLFALYFIFKVSPESYTSGIYMKGSRPTTLPLRKGNQQNTTNARKSGGLSALADPPTAEETAFASMTLVLRELLKNEPSYEDEELLTSSTSAGNVAQWERDDIAAFTLDSRFSPPRRQSGRVSSGSDDSTESSSEGSSPNVVSMAEKLDTTTLMSSRKAASEAHAFITSVITTPSSSSRCAARMYQIVTSLCVYANHNLHLRGSIGEVPQLYYDLCIKGRDAAASVDPPPSIAKNLFGSPTKQASPGPSKPNVSFKAEIEDDNSLRDGTDIMSLLATSNVPKGASDAIMETYYLERLLDDGLPPAVCSSRFEGLAALLQERKGRVVAELMASRGALGAMIKAPHVTGSQMLSLLMMGAHANPKLRVKLYDRFVQEGGIWALLRGRDAKARTIISQEGLHVALDALLLLMDPALDDCDPLLGTGAIPSCDGEPAGSPRGKPSKAPPTPPPSQQAPTPNLRCTAWTTDTDMLASVLSFIVNSVKRVSSESALRVGPTMLKIPHNPFTLPSGVQALWSKTSLLLQYVIAHSATMAAVVVGVMDSVLEQVLCLCVQLFLPPMLTLLKRPEAKDHEESIVEWFSVLAAQVTFVRGDISRGGGAGFASPLQLTTSRKSLLKIQIPASPISPRHGHKTVPITTASPVLTKAAMEGVVPYLAFARAVAMHTRWRDGVVIFFSRCVNAADAIVLQARRRPNVLFGTACDCLLAVGPLVVGKPPIPPASPSIARPVTVLSPSGRRSGSKRGRSPSGPASPTARPSGGAGSEGTPDLNSLTLMPPREDFSAEPCSPKHIKGLKAEDSPHSPVMGIALSPPTPGVSPLPLTSQVPWRERMSLALFGSSWGEPLPPRSPSTPSQPGGGKRRTAPK